VKALLGAVRDRASERKRGLFAAACCRQIWHLLEDERSRMAAEAAERFLEGTATNDLLEDVEQGAQVADVLLALGHDTATTLSAYSAYCLGRWSQADPGWDFALAAANSAADAARAAGTEAHQLALLRCVFGNPFRSTAIETAWLTATVWSLAQAAYGERDLPSGHLDPARLAVLSDALEEAGCTAAEILSHLRSPGPHVRGCWALDLILGKE
jgi:hypothetical protein